jgi:hypothetical protein
LHKFVREAVSDPAAVLKGTVSQSAQQFSPCRIFSHCWQRHGSTNVRHAMR